jgi:hypothetical protein
MDEIFLPGKPPGAYGLSCIDAPRSDHTPFGRQAQRNAMPGSGLLAVSAS